jgi:hypothetical protein
LSSSLRRRSGAAARMAAQWPKSSDIREYARLQAQQGRQRHVHVKLWNTDTGLQMGEYRPTDFPVRVDVSGEGSAAIVREGRTTVTVIELATGRVLPGHISQDLSTSFSYNSRCEQVIGYEITGNKTIRYQQGYSFLGVVLPLHACK